MKVSLNDYELNDPSNRTYLDEDMTGFELPAIRTSRGIRSGQAGSYFGAQLFDSRNITLTGHVFSADLAEALQKRRDIQAALPLYPDQVTLRMVDDDGQAYIIYCQVRSFTMPIKRQRLKHLFKIELEAPDPTIYDDTAGASLSATIQKAVPGGMLFSSTTPTFGTSTSFSPGTPNSTVVNPGALKAWPVITITGKTTNPVITNLATGETFYMTGYAVDSSAVTVIDTNPFTQSVTLNGGNVFGYVPLDSGWPGLIPGPQDFAFSSDSSLDASSALLEWRSGLWGI